MTYQELQEKAKSLGLPYVGVPKKDLEDSIKAAESNSTPSENNKEQTSTSTQATDTTNQENEPTPKMPKVDYNVAHVVGDNKKARKYTKEIHGENFIELAHQYAMKNKLRVELKREGNLLRCPNCGEKLPVDTK